jgi:phosphopantetheine--protein transferase-like protein
LTAVSEEVTTTCRARLDWLSDRERTRLARLQRPADQDAFVVAHVLVRAAAPGTELVQRCAVCGGGDHGAPTLVGDPVERGVSLAHADGWVAVALSAPGGVAGVDVVSLASAAKALASGRRVLSDMERQALAEDADPQRAFAELWSRREACFKAGVSESPYVSEPEHDLSVWTLEPQDGLVLAAATSDPTFQLADGAALL